MVVLELRRAREVATGLEASLAWPTSAFGRGTVAATLLGLGGHGTATVGERERVGRKGGLSVLQIGEQGAVASM